MGWDGRVGMHSPLGCCAVYVVHGVTASGGCPGWMARLVKSGLFRPHSTRSEARWSRGPSRPPSGIRLCGHFGSRSVHFGQCKVLCLSFPSLLQGIMGGSSAGQPTVCAAVAARPALSLCSYPDLPPGVRDSLWYDTAWGAGFGRISLGKVCPSRPSHWL